MKKIFLSLPVVLLALSFFYSCEKEPTTVVSSINGTNDMATVMTEEDDYFDKIVHTAALGIMELSKDEQFRALVHSKCLEMFDGDYNVLLKDLNVSMLNQGQDMVANFGNSINSNVNTINANEIMMPYGHFEDEEHVQQVINGFNYYDQQKFVQIYVSN